MKKFKFFEYSNTSGEIFRVPYNTKEEQNKAWIKMWKYYDSDDRMHSIRDILDLETESEDPSHIYNMARSKHIPSIKKLLKRMWESDILLSSFYGKVCVCPGKE